MVDIAFEWLLISSISTVTANGQEGISKFVDSVYDSAFDMSVKAGDLPNVRWGRIDYFNVTAVTTKWNVWSYAMALYFLYALADITLQSTLSCCTYQPRQGLAFLQSHSNQGER